MSKFTRPRRAKPGRRCSYNRLTTQPGGQRIGSRDRTREEAGQQLVKTGIAARAQLLETLRETDSEEVRYRLRQLISQIEMNAKSCFDVDRDRRQLRMIYVLEKIGTDEARQAIRRLAQPHARSMIVSCAHSALARLAKTSDSRDQ